MIYKHNGCAHLRACLTFAGHQPQSPSSPLALGSSCTLPPPPSSTSIASLSPSSSAPPLLHHWLNAPATRVLHFPSFSFFLLLPALVFFSRHHGTTSSHGRRLSGTLECRHPRTPRLSGQQRRHCRRVARPRTKSRDPRNSSGSEHSVAPPPRRLGCKRRSLTAPAVRIACRATLSGAAAVAAGAATRGAGPAQRRCPLVLPWRCPLDLRYSCTVCRKR